MDTNDIFYLQSSSLGASGFTEKSEGKTGVLKIL